MQVKEVEHTGLAPAIKQNIGHLDRNPLSLYRNYCSLDRRFPKQLKRLYARQTHRAREKLFIDYAGPTVAHPPQLRHIFVAAWAPPVMPVPT